MRKNLYVLEILQYFCHDKDLVEFFSKDELERLIDMLKSLG